MRILKPILFFGIMAIMTALLIFATGCDEDNPADSDNALQLPPQSSFVMTFDDFVGEEQAGKINATMTKDNWGYAALNVAVWNTVLTVALAVPVASFLEAFKHQPVIQPDGSWQWSYNFLAGGLHTAVLNGKVVEGEVQWNMYISKLEEYTDFLWYSGVCNPTRTEGSWTLNADPEDPTPFLLIEWHNNSAEGTADLKYTNIIPEHAENGGYIFYGVVNSEDYDRFYSIYNKGLDNLTDIEWNFTDKNGRISDENHFEDALWHCWDNLLDDIDCPVE